MEKIVGMEFFLWADIYLTFMQGVFSVSAL